MRSLAKYWELPDGKDGQAISTVVKSFKLSHNDMTGIADLTMELPAQIVLS